MKRTHILAIGGMALPAELDNLALVEYFLAQTKRKRPKVLYVGTATGVWECRVDGITEQLAWLEEHQIDGRHLDAHIAKAE